MAYKNKNTTKKYSSNSANTGKNALRCEIFGKCGGCQYIDRDYEEQLKLKYDMLSRLMAPYGKLESVIGMDKPEFYRNKVNATFKRLKSGEIIAGTYEEGTHNVLRVKECILEDKRAQGIIKSICTLISSFKIELYNEDKAFGLLRHVMVRTAKNTGQIMVVLITAAPVFPSKKNFIKALTDMHPEITTIVQNVNSRHTSMVLGDRNNVLYGKGYIEDVLCGKRFRISPTSFYQINPVQTEKLYNKAMEFAGLTGRETMIDAYCGTGTIGIIASDYAKEVIGVELNKDAIRDANVNARMNSVKNISFYNNDAGKFMVNLNKDIDVVFMDPPRSGSSEQFLQSVIRLSPKRIVYISCGPESLARDLKYLTRKSSFMVDKIAAFDLFPWTEHVETVCLLSRKVPV